MASKLQWVQVGDVDQTRLFNRDIARERERKIMGGGERRKDCERERETVRDGERELRKTK